MKHAWYLKVCDVQLVNFLALSFVQITNHFSRPGVYAKEVLPVFPDFDVSHTYTGIEVCNIDIHVI